MIKMLKLQKAVIAIVLGIIVLVVSQIMDNYKIAGSGILLGISGVFLIIGSLIFLYPILFAKKVDNEGEEVELKPASKEPIREGDPS